MHWECSGNASHASHTVEVLWREEQSNRDAWASALYLPIGTPTALFDRRLCIRRTWFLFASVAVECLCKARADNRIMLVSTSRQTDQFCLVIFAEKVMFSIEPRRETLLGPRALSPVAIARFWRDLEHSRSGNGRFCHSNYPVARKYIVFRNRFFDFSRRTELYGWCRRYSNAETHVLSWSSSNYSLVRFCIFFCLLSTELN